MKAQTQKANMIMKQPLKVKQEQHRVARARTANMKQPQIAKMDRLYSQKLHQRRFIKRVVETTVLVANEPITLKLSKHKQVIRQQ